MGTPWIVIAAILAIALLYVLVPVVTDAFRRYRRRKILRCPETGRDTGVAIDASTAALTSAFGPPVLRVKDCSLWPERKDCEQGCLPHLREADSPHPR
jgi:hypothetical protein